MCCFNERHDGKLLTVGLCRARVLLAVANCAKPPQAVVEASIGVELVLGKGCAGDGER